MGCFPSCPSLEEGIFRHRAATRRLTVLEMLPPRPASSMGFPFTAVGRHGDDRNSDDSALQDRILINAMSMARVRAATTRLHNAITLIPNLTLAFPVDDKPSSPLSPAPMLGCPSTAGDCTCPDMRASEFRSAYPNLSLIYPGIGGMTYYKPPAERFETMIPSTTRASSSTSAATLVPPRLDTPNIPQSMSYNDISRPLPMPPRARVRGATLTPSYSTPAIFTQGGVVLITKDGPVEIPRAAYRPFTPGGDLTLEERAERLARMRKQALAVVEARELEGNDEMPVPGLEEIEEGGDVEQDQAHVDTSVWI